MGSVPQGLGSPCHSQNHPAGKDGHRGGDGAQHLWAHSVPGHMWTSQCQPGGPNIPNQTLVSGPIPEMIGDAILGVTQRPWWPCLPVINRAETALGGEQGAPGAHCGCPGTGHQLLLQPSAVPKQGLEAGKGTPMSPVGHPSPTHVPATPPCSPLLAPVTITVLPVRSVGHWWGSQGFLRVAQSSRARNRSSRSHHGGLGAPSSSMAGRGVGLGTEVTAGPLPSWQHGTARHGSLCPVSRWGQQQARGRATRPLCHPTVPSGTLSGVTVNLLTLIKPQGFFLR